MFPRICNDLIMQYTESYNSQCSNVFPNTFKLWGELISNVGTNKSISCMISVKYLENLKYHYNLSSAIFKHFILQMKYLTVLSYVSFNWQLIIQLLQLKTPKVKISPPVYIPSMYSDLFFLL